MQEKSNNVLDLVYTVSETAQILKVNKNTVYDLIHSGILRCIKLGSNKITAKSLNEFLETYDGDISQIPEFINKMVENGQLDKNDVSSLIQSFVRTDILNASNLKSIVI